MVAIPSRETRPAHRAGLPLDLHARAQHVLLLLSVLLLAGTGLPQKFDSLGPSRWIMDNAGGIETLRDVHHVAGGVLIFAGLYHVALVLNAIRSRAAITPLKMIPGPRDYLDAWRMVCYFLGLRRRPVAGEGPPSYFQKYDYWVLVWGLTVMGVSGLIRLFPVRMADLLSADAVAAALQIHSDIAVLMVVWVLIVHVPYAALAPPRFARPAAAGGPADDPPVPTLLESGVYPREEDLRAGGDQT